MRRGCSCSYGVPVPTLVSYESREAKTTTPTAAASASEVNGVSLGSKDGRRRRRRGWSSGSLDRTTGTVREPEGAERTRRGQE